MSSSRSHLMRSDRKGGAHDSALARDERLEGSPEQLGTLLHGGHPHARLPRASGAAVVANLEVQLRLEGRTSQRSVLLSAS